MVHSTPSGGYPFCWLMPFLHPAYNGVVTNGHDGPTYLPRKMGLVRDSIEKEEEEMKCSNFYGNNKVRLLCRLTERK